MIGVSDESLVIITAGDASPALISVRLAPSRKESAAGLNVALVRVFGELFRPAVGSRYYGIASADVGGRRRQVVSAVAA